MNELKPIKSKLLMNLDQRNVLINVCFWKKYFVNVSTNPVKFKIYGQEDPLLKIYLMKKCILNNNQPTLATSCPPIQSRLTQSIRLSPKVETISMLPWYQALGALSLQVTVKRCKSAPYWLTRKRWELIPRKIMKMFNISYI